MSGPAGVQGRLPSIQVGYVNTTAGNAAAFGLNTGETITPDKMFRALVKAMNERGGLVGRKIVPVVSNTDTASANWNTDFQAACSDMTEDHKVSVVVGYVFGSFDNFEDCLNRAGIVHIATGYGAGDRTFLDKHPLLFSSAPDTDRRYLLQAKAAVDAGFLTPKSKLGLLIDECPADKRAIDRTLRPYLKAARITVAAETVMGCPSGQSDTGPVVAQISNAVLQFQSRGVDRVFIEGVPYVLFASAAEQQRYRPGYVVTSTAGGGVIEAQPIPKAQLQNTRGNGYWAIADVGFTRQPPLNANQQRCRALLRSQSVIPGSATDMFQAYGMCEGLFLYELALKVNGNTAVGTEVARTIRRVGRTFRSLLTYDGLTSLGTGRHDMPTRYRPWGYDDGCSCFTFTGPTKAI